MLALSKAIWSALSESSAIQALGVTQIVQDVVVDGVQRAPESTGPLVPYIVIQKQAAIDNYVHDRRSSTNFTYLIKCVDASPSVERAELVAEAIDSTLDLQALAIDGGMATQFLHRRQAVSYSEVKNGVIYRHRGGIYAMMVAYLIA